MTESNTPSKFSKWIRPIGVGLLIGLIAIIHPIIKHLSGGLEGPFVYQVLKTLGLKNIYSLITFFLIGLSVVFGFPFNILSHTFSVDFTISFSIHILFWFLAGIVVTRFSKTTTISVFFIFLLLLLTSCISLILIYNVWRSGNWS